MGEEYLEITGTIQPWDVQKPCNHCDFYNQLPTHYCNLQVFHDAHHPAGISIIITDLQLRNFEKSNEHPRSRPRPPVSPSREFPRSLVLKDALAQGRHDLVDAPARQGLDLWGAEPKQRRKSTFFFLRLVYPKQTQPRAFKAKCDEAITFWPRRKDQTINLRGLWIL